MSASILATDYGPWLLAAVGLAVCGFEIAQILQTTRRGFFRMQFDRYQLTSQQENGSRISAGLASLPAGWFC